MVVSYGRIYVSLVVLSSFQFSFIMVVVFILDLGCDGEFSYLVLRGCASPLVLVISFT